MRRLLVALACVTTLFTHAGAQQIFQDDTFTLPAAALGPNTFEIIEADGAGGSQIWCAAGIYARRVLGQRGGDITIVRARGPSEAFPDRVGVVFTTANVRDASTGFSASTRRVGLRFSMQHAFSLCTEMPRLRLRLDGGQLIRRGI